MKKIFFYFLISGLLLVRCNSGDSDAIVEKPLVAEENTKGTLLAKVELAKGYTVQFLELAPGTMGIKTSYSADAKVLPEINVDEMINEGKSFVDIYKTLAKENVSAAQMKALEGALGRFKVENTVLDFDDKGSVENENSKSTNSAGKVGGDVDMPGIPDRQACAPDYYDDRYSQEWFRETYGWFPVASTNQHDRSFEVTCYEITFVAMAADFWTGGFFRTFSKNKNGTWRTWVDDYMEPRTVHFYHFWSNKRHVFRADAIGLSPCARVHIGYKGDRR